MRISSIDEYGLRCLVALAKEGPGRQLSISEIAEMEGLSVPYASKLLSILRKAELVTAERGRGGGFTLSREPKDINLYDVITTLGGPIVDPKHCQKFSGQMDQCVHIGNCSVHEVLGGLAGYIRYFLKQTTLQDLITGVRLNLTKPDGEVIELSVDRLKESENTNENKNAKIEDSTVGLH